MHAPTRRLGTSTLVCALALLLALVLGGSAAASGGLPRGALIPVRGPGSCLGHGCLPLRGFGRSPGQIYTRSEGTVLGSNGINLTLSAGGGSVVVSGGFPQALAVLQRDRRTGAVRQPAGDAGCITQRRVHGCARAHLPFDGAAQLSADGRTLWIRPSEAHPNRWLRYVRDQHTGALLRSGTATACDVYLQARCPRLRGVQSVDGVVPAGSTMLVLGNDRGGGALAVLARAGGSRWVQLPGAAGCANNHGADGCAAVRCLWQDPGLVASADDGRHLYVTPGYSDPEATEEGYLATFVRAPGGGVTPVGCVPTGYDRDAGFAPVWISTLPHSDTLLLLQIRGDRGDGRGWGQFFASEPGRDGALTKPRPLGGHNGLGPFYEGAAVTPDRRTLYAIANNGGIEAWHLAPNSVRRLPGTWGAVRSAPVNAGVYSVSGLLVSPDGRFLYAGFGSSDTSQVPTAPTLRVYRTTR